MAVELWNPSSGWHIRFEPLDFFESQCGKQRPQIVEIIPFNQDLEDAEDVPVTLDLTTKAASRELYVGTRFALKQPDAFPTFDDSGPETANILSEPVVASAAGREPEGQNEECVDPASTHGKVKKHVRFTNDCKDTHYAYGTTMHQVVPIPTHLCNDASSRKLARAGSFDMFKWNAVGTDQQREQRQWAEIPSHFNNQCAVFKDSKTNHWHFRPVTLDGHETWSEGNVALRAKLRVFKLMKLKMLARSKFENRPQPLLHRVDLD